MVRVFSSVCSYPRMRVPYLLRCALTAYKFSTNSESVSGCVLLMYFSVFSVVRTKWQRCSIKSVVWKLFSFCKHHSESCFPRWVWFKVKEVLQFTNFHLCCCVISIKISIAGCSLSWGGRVFESMLLAAPWKYRAAPPGAPQAGTWAGQPKMSKGASCLCWHGNPNTPLWQSHKHYKYPLYKQL